MQVQLLPDEKEEWDDIIADKIHGPKINVSPTASSARVLMERVAIGACTICGGTEFYSVPGATVCAGCHPPLGTQVTMTTCSKSATGQWEAGTVTLG